MKKILPVPYISQFSPELDKEWHYKACGIACVGMLLGYYNLEDISLDKILREALLIGGYSENRGWFHESLVRVLRNHGIHAYAEEFRSIKVSAADQIFTVSDFEEKMSKAGLAKIIGEIDAGHPVLVSVDENFHTNLEKHILVVVGYDFSDGQERLIFHDARNPNHEAGFAERSVDIARFMKFWRKFAIFSYL